MEKSIEIIWKEGFTNEQSLFVPRIENINDLKSIYFIDTFKRKYKNNIILLCITAIMILPAFILGGVPFIGIFMFLLFGALIITSQKKLNQFNQFNLSHSNYDYLKFFNDWLNDLLYQFSFIYKIWIPLFICGFSLAILQTNLFVPFIGETILERISDQHILGILPIAWIITTIIIAFIFSYYSNYIFKKEFNSIYGDTVNRIQQSLNEMEELKK